MKFPLQSLVYVVCATILFGCLATEIGTPDYGRQSIITKVIILVFVGLSGWMLVDAVNEYKKNH